MRNNSKGWAEGLLAAVIIARSTSYLFAKSALAELEPFTLLALRFLLAFLLLAIPLWKRLRVARLATILRGAALGAVFFSVMAAETFGLRQADTSTAALLENVAIVIVPLLQAALLRHLPRPAILGGALMALLGIALLSSGSDGFALQGGEALCLLAALLYAIAILLTDRLSRQDDPVLLGVLQVGVMGILSLLFAFLTETPCLPATPEGWGSILWLAIVCSGFGFTLQPMAQRHATPERTAMFCALNPLTATLLGILFLQEPFGWTDLMGAILILAGILLAGRAKAA